MVKQIMMIGGVWLISFSSLAGTSNIDTAFMKGIQGNIHNNQTQTSLSIIYGGQDISPQRLAVANESILAGQQTLIG